MPTYNQRLTANNTKIDDITDIARTLPPAGGSSDPNIFVQLEEPTTKKGIWLQKEAEPEHYIYDEEVFIGGEWEADGKYRNIPYEFYSGSVVAVDTDIYILGGYNSTHNNYKYDTLTNTYTKMTDIPYVFRASPAAAIGTNIYLFGSGYSGDSLKVYKYDTLTNTYTQLTNLPARVNTGAAVVIGTNIYLFYRYDSSNKCTYKYDTLTDTYTQISDIPYNFYNGAAVAISTNIYLFGGSGNGSYSYKYDTLTDTYTKLANIPYTFLVGSVTAIGTNIYLFGGSSVSPYEQCYKYDTLTNTYTQLTDIPYSFYNGSAVVVGVSNYLFGGSPNLTKVQVYVAENKSYEQDNLVVISQGKYSSVGYEVELYNNSKDVTSPKYAFADAWYYTIEGGLETDIPTYYGDGTQWINIKNPPTTD